MKKIALVLAATMALGVAGFAQKNKRTTAYMAFGRYQKDKDASELMKAKINMDFTDKVNSITDVTDAGKKQMMAYTLAPQTNLIEASNAYLKTKQLDTKKVFPAETSKGLADCYTYTQNVGIANYNQQKYNEALPMFEMAADITASAGKTDTSNISNAAQSAFYGKNWAKAESHFNKLISMKYGKGNTYMLLAKVYAEQGDSMKYKSTIADGLKAYPTDGDLLVEDVNIKLKEGKSNEAIQQLNALTAQRPNLINKSAEHYKKAIEIKPDYFDAYYNLGVLYMNQSVEYYNRSISTIKDAAKYGTMWEKPLPDAIKYLEKAHELNSKDLNCMLALKQCYGNAGENDKYAAMKEKIKAAQNGK
ncbi:MAG: tetratricopeptide repeat protein [Bacteroidetes bacterium]|nr:tetratricopeptide repeat protein [Bacteroidota bacterium]